MLQQTAMSEQFGVNQEVDLGHTERLNHLAQGECYQYRGDAVDHASYMYCQQGNVRNDVPHNYHHKQYYHSNSVDGKILTLKAPITTAADEKFCEIFPNF